MNQTLPKEVHRKMKEVSMDLGISERDLVRQALAYYLDSLSPYLSLQRELKAWDRLSGEAFLRFEKSL